MGREAGWGKDIPDMHSLTLLQVLHGATRFTDGAASVDNALSRIRLQPAVGVYLVYGSTTDPYRSRPWVSSGRSSLGLLPA